MQSRAAQRTRGSGGVIKVQLQQRLERGGGLVRAAQPAGRARERREGGQGGGQVRRQGRAGQSELPGRAARAAGKQGSRRSRRGRRRRAGRRSTAAELTAGAVGDVALPVVPHDGAVGVGDHQGVEVRVARALKEGDCRGAGRGAARRVLSVRRWLRVRVRKGARAVRHELRPTQGVRQAGGRQQAPLLTGQHDSELARQLGKALDQRALVHGLKGAR